MFFNDLYGYFADQRSLALRTIFKIYVAGGKTRRKLERSAVFREHISLCFFFFKFHKEGWIIAIDIFLKENMRNDFSENILNVVR